jgi:hypothetical protein
MSLQPKRYLITSKNEIALLAQDLHGQQRGGSQSASSIGKLVKKGLETTMNIKKQKNKKNKHYQQLARLEPREFRHFLHIAVGRSASPWRRRRTRCEDDGSGSWWGGGFERRGDAVSFEMFSCKRHQSVTY